jgi:hypothetical protein
VIDVDEDERTDFYEYLDGDQDDDEVVEVDRRGIPVVASRK